MQTRVRPSAIGGAPHSTPRSGGEPPPYWNEYRRQAAEPYLRVGRAVGPAAGALALPAAALIPAAIAALNGGDNYGDAGGAVAGGLTAAGGLVGGMVGRHGGGLVAGAPDRRYGLRTGGGVLGALLGAGIGAGAGGLVNTAAKAAVDKADSGQPGMISDIGRALDGLGYRSTRDIETAQLNQMAASPAYQAIEQQRLTSEALRRSRMAEELYLQVLAQGAMRQY
jgi:hypothetical protein